MFRPFVVYRLSDMLDCIIIVLVLVNLRGRPYIGFSWEGPFRKEDPGATGNHVYRQIFCTDVYEAEFHVLGFSPPGLEKAILLFEENLYSSLSGTPSGMRAVAMLFKGRADAHLTVAMSRICSRYSSSGMRQTSADRTFIFVE